MPRDAETTTFSWDEVRRHSSATDCWMVCDGCVYDTSAFVPAHPGGARLWIFGGGDISVFFRAMHPPRVTVESHLAKYYIGKIVTGQPVLGASRMPAAIPKVSDQYLALREFVWARLAEELGTERLARMLQSPKTYAAWYPCFTTLYFAAFAAIFFLPSLTLWGRALLTIPAALLAAHVSFIIHEVSHNRLRCSGVSWAILLSDLSGFWSHAFVHEHLAHHQVQGQDLSTLAHDAPDIFENMPFLRHRESEKLRWWHRYQHLYFLVGWALFLVKSYLEDIYRRCRAEYVRPVNVITLLVAKLPILILLALSVYIGPFQGSDCWKPFVLLLTMLALAGCLIGLAVGVVHIGALSASHQAAVGLPAPTYTVVGSDSADAGDFMDTIIRSTMSIVPPRTMNFITLGLAYHVEHHLFPSMPYWLLPRVNELVTQHCAASGVRVNNRLSYTAAYCLYIEALRQLGRRPRAGAPLGAPMKAVADSAAAAEPV